MTDMRDTFFIFIPLVFTFRLIYNDDSAQTASQNTIKPQIRLSLFLMQADLENHRDRIAGPGHRAAHQRFSRIQLVRQPTPPRPSQETEERQKTILTPHKSR